MRIPFLIFAIAISVAAVPAVYGDNSDDSRLYQPSELQEDFTILRAAINEAHAGALRYISTDQLEQAYVSAETQLGTPMNAVEYFRILAPLIATLRDGHTSIGLSEIDRNIFYRQATFIPLRMHVSGGRLFVLRDLSGGSLAGMEILSINGEGAPEILSEMMQATAGDGDIISGREASLSRGFRFNELYAMLRGTGPVYRVVAGPDRAVHEVTGDSREALRGVWINDFPADHLTLPRAELRYEDGGEIAIMTIRGFGEFADIAETQPMEAFFEESFQAIGTRASGALIIDLRNNRGGRDIQGRQLFAYLARNPFQYYDGLYLQSERFSFSEHASPPVPGPPPNLYERDGQGRLRVRNNPNYGMHQPESARFVGRVYVLMNGASFSTTAEFLSVAHSNLRASFIGEEAGGGYQGNTSGFVLTVTLPNTGLRAQIPVQRYELAVGDSPLFARGVQPDYAVMDTVADRIAGRDASMETALRLARQSQ
jgi:hypothetical protein